MASIKGSQSCFSVIDDSVEMMPKEMAAGSSAARAFPPRQSTAMASAQIRKRENFIVLPLFIFLDASCARSAL